MGNIHKEIAANCSLAGYFPELDVLSSAFGKISLISTILNFLSSFAMGPGTFLLVNTIQVS